MIRCARVLHRQEGGEITVATILVVDDSPSVRNLVAFALKARGHAVVAVTDGVEGLEALQRAPFDLVVLDINMPRLDGVSLLQLVRARTEWAELPVLMLTTEGQEADRDRALALGATDYMIKPFKPTELLDRVSLLITT
jgi:two-component system, chemotaxis family, chemotaxis protein CheY